MWLGVLFKRAGHRLDVPSTSATPYLEQFSKHASDAEASIIFSVSIEPSVYLSDSSRYQDKLLRSFEKYNIRERCLSELGDAGKEMVSIGERLGATT
jgi:hypothetical protein